MIGVVARLRTLSRVDHSLINQDGEDRAVFTPIIPKPAASNEKVTGYLHAAYSQSLSQFGSPRFLKASGAWILERPIPDSAYSDAMGCYPLFACRDWSDLHIDLENIGRSIVSLSLVTDPFGEYEPAYLSRCFPEVTAPFKEHFVVDLSRPVEEFVSSHHRRNADKALAEVSVERCLDPKNSLNEWTALYRTLVERHGITGIAAFSRESFARQLSVPGMVAFRAVREDATVGMVLWYEQGNRVYYHLGAYSPFGYELRASFGLFDASIRHFAQRQFEWLSLGAAAGVDTDPSQGSGLHRFKRGWSTDTRTAYFCGRIFDQKKYQEIIASKGVPPTNYFPAYRLGEFS